MHRLKGVLVLLLALLLIGVCAVVPRLLVGISKTISTSEIQHRPLPSLSYEPQESDRADIFRKLRILRYGGQWVYVTDAMMQSSEEKILTAMGNYLELFWDAGALPQVDDYREEHLQPYMIYDKEGDEYDLFWFVDATRYSPELSSIIRICGLMDDKSHHVFSLSYGVYPEPDTNAEFTPGRERTEAFCRLYFQTLGLNPVPVENPDNLFLQYTLSKEDNLLFEFDNQASGITMFIREIDPDAQ